MPTNFHDTNGTEGRDLLFVDVPGTINAGGNDDLVLADIFDYYEDTGGFHSFETAFDLDTRESVWTTNENALVGDSTIPHMMLVATTVPDTQNYYSIALTEGQEVVVDIDIADHFVGENFFDSYVAIYDAEGTLIAENDDGDVGADIEGQGTVSFLDSFLTFTAPSTGTFYIVVGQYNGNTDAQGNIIGVQQYILNVSVSGHAVVAGSSGSAQTINGGDGWDVLMAGPGNDIIFGDAGDDRLFGGSGDDAIQAGDGFDYVEGGPGNDIIVGGLDNDSLSGGAGIDTLSGNQGDDFLDGGTRADALFGGSGGDFMFGGSGNDRMNGGSGEDLLVGGPDDDLMVGGPDNDTLIGGAGNDEMIGGSGVDVADYTESAAGIALNLANGTSVGEGNDTLVGIENVIGTSFDDIIVGDIGANNLQGSGGEDTISGRSGDDAISGGSRADAIFGGSGNDVLGGDGGNDRMNGGSGDDTMFGGTDNDLIVGGPGNDIIIGELGNDTMSGGSGDDTYVFGANSGDDMIMGFTAGGDEDDLDFSALGIGFADLAIVQQGDDTLITTPGGDTILLVGVMADTLDSTADFVFAA